MKVVLNMSYAKSTIFSFTMVALLVVLSASFAKAQNSSVSLTTLQFYLVGGELTPQPSYQAVPRTFTTQVDAPFKLPESVGGAGITFEELLPYLPKDLIVKAELRGPAFASPVQLTALPNHPIELPTLPILGVYTVENIRMESGGRVVAASPGVVQVEAIDKVLITQVTTRPLSLEEIQQRGIPITSENFTVLNFTAALSFQSRDVHLQIPITLPPDETLNVEGVGGGREPGVGTPICGFQRFAEAGETAPRDEFIPSDCDVIPDLEIQPFVLKEISETLKKEEFPKISGIIVFPGSIGFLHQFFDATLIVNNGAPAASVLSIHDVKAKMVLPTGLDRVSGTDAVPGDDPLRAAGTTATGGVPMRELFVVGPGPDGQFGTPDDAGTLGPQQTGQANFTLEGLKEGSHQIDFEITATLEGLPRGPVQITGRASGIIVVRNPNFALTLSHPATVRAGVEYTLYATVTNTSEVTANLISVKLDPFGVSGATLLSSPDTQIETLPPGAAGTVSFRLKSRVTGKVNATVFPSDDQIKGSFILRTGVGVGNIPLSPDTLILSSFADYLPEDVRTPAIGFLGEAYSVATAPPGALPKGIARISRKTVESQGANIGEAGLRLFIGQSLEHSLHTMLLDLLGSDTPNAALDRLRRISYLAIEMNTAIGTELLPFLHDQGAAALQASLASRATDRGPYLSILTSGVGGTLSVASQMRDPLGRVLGGSSFSPITRDIPYADLVNIGAAGTPEAQMLLHSAPMDGTYTLEWTAIEAGQIDIGIVLPGAAGLEQATFDGVEVFAGDHLSLTLTVPRSGSLNLLIDRNGDGVTDALVAPTGVTPVPDPGPVLDGAAQIFDFDGKEVDLPGRVVAVLMSRRLVKEQVESVAPYAPEANGVIGASLQPSGRMVFVRLRDPFGPYIERKITIAGLTDRRGVLMSPLSQTTIMRATGTGVVVRGRVLTPEGQPITDAQVLFYYLHDDGMGGLVPVRIAVKPVEEDGGYQYDYFGSHLIGRRVEAFVTKANGTRTFVGLPVQERFPGQQLNLDLFFPGQGTVTGTVRDTQGRPLPNVYVDLQTFSPVALSDPPPVKSDASGRYVFNEIPVGNFLLTATTAADFATAPNLYGAVNGTLLADGETAHLDLPLYPISNVTGKVIGQVLANDGVTPREGIPVFIRTVGYGFYRLTDAEGRFAFSRVPPGEFTVEAEDQSTSEKGKAVSNLVPNGTENVVILLNGTGSVVGTVTRPGGEPISGALITAGRSFAYTDATGSYRLEGVSLGLVPVLARDALGRTASLSVSLTFAGQEVRADMELTPLGSVEGKVFKTDGVTPVANVTVRIIIDTTSCPLADNCIIYKVVEGKSDAEGNYRIDRVPIPPKFPTVIAEQDLRTSVGNASFRLIVDGQVAHADVILISPGTVTGTVIDTASHDLPTGANISITAVEPNNAGLFEYRLIGTTQSDPQTGRFTMKGAWPMPPNPGPLPNPGPFQVKAFNVFRPVPAYASGAIRFGGDVQDVTLRLIDNAGSISGIVYQPDGVTHVGLGVAVTLKLAGAPVTVTTHPDGTFQFAPILPQATYRLVAEDSATGHVGEGLAKVFAGQDTSVTLRLLGLGTVNVAVNNADGTPVQNATVKLTQHTFPSEKRTATLFPSDNGQISFTFLSEGVFSVEASDPSGLGGRATGKVSREGETVTVTVTLAPSGVVTGRFLAVDGRTPIPNAQIQLFRGTAPYIQSIGYLTTSSDPADLGAFRFEHVPLGSMTVEGFDPVTTRKGKGFGQLSANDQVLVIDVIQTPRGTVTGRALVADGSRPVEGGIVKISVSGISDDPLESLTAPDGSFTFPGVSAGIFTVEVKETLTGLVGKATGRITQEGETVTVEVRLEPTGTIHVTVLKADGVTPAAGAQVEIRSRSSLYATLQTDASGQGSRSLLSLLHYDLLARAPNSLDAGTAAADLKAEGDIADVVLHLNGTGTVRGTVSESNGTTPADGALVTVSYRGALSGSLSYQTGPNGSYVFQGVPAGTLSLSAKNPDHTLAASATGTLAHDGDTVVIDLTYQPSGTVTGVLIAPDGTTPSAGGLVTLRRGLAVFNVITDNAGAFRFEGVPLGTFTLEMSEAAGKGVAYRSGNLATNGQTIDFGNMVLDDRPPHVSVIAPADGTVNVSVSTPVTVTFDEPVDPATVNGNTIKLLKGTTAVSVTLALSADGIQATLTPSSALVGSTRYTVVVATAVQDRERHFLPEEVKAGFTTVDNIPPTVVSISPADGTLQVDPIVVVRVAFSEPIDPTTVAITLTRAGLEVPGRVDIALNQTVAIFTPTEPLSANASYVASLSGVKDLAGNLLAAPPTVRFDTFDTIPPTVTGLSLPSGLRLILGRVVTATATVADSDVVSVEFSVDDRLAGTATVVPFAAPVTLTPASGNVLLLKAIAVDRVGNRSVPRFMSVTVEPNAPPTVAIQNAPATVEVGTTLSVSVRGQDDLGVTSLRLEASGAVSAAQTKTYAVQPDVTATFSILIPAGATPGGVMTLKTTVNDGTGGVAEVSADVTVVDTTAPKATITAPASGPVIKGSTVTVNVSATDVAGISQIELSSSAGTITSANPVYFVPASIASASFTLIADPAAVDQVITLTAKAVDRAGNLGNSTGVSLTVIPVPASLTAIEVAATTGTPANTGASANLGQTASVVGADLRADVKVRFTTKGDTGVAGTLDAAIVAGSVAADGTRAQVVIPPSSAVVTGPVTLFDPRSNHLSSSTVLQVIPTITTLDVPIFAAGQPMKIKGTGFVENKGTVTFTQTSGDSVSVSDLGNEIDVQSGNTVMVLATPAGAGTGSLVVRTDGGTSAPFVFAVPKITALISTAAFGTPADSAKPSANTGQTVAISGEGLGSSVVLRVVTMSDTKVAGTLDLPLIGVSTDGTTAQALIDPQGSVTTGAVRLMNPATGIGSAEAVVLQIVPTLDPPTATSFGAAQPITLTGSGFVEDGTTISFPAVGGGTVDVVDTGANADVTNKNRTMSLLVPSGVGPGSLTVATAGGRSAPVTLSGIPTPVSELTLRPNPFTVAPAQTAPVTISVPTADPFDRTISLTTGDVSIATAPPSIVLPGGVLSVTASIAGVAQGATTLTAALTNGDGSTVTAGVPVYVAPPLSGSALVHAVVGVYVQEVTSGPGSSSVVESKPVGVDVIGRDPLGSSRINAPPVGVNFPESGTTQPGTGGALSPPVGVAVAETVTRLSQSTLAQGEQVTFRVFGTDLGLVTELAFDPPTGITVVNPPVVDSDARGLTATVSVAATAVEGLRKVLVKTSAGTILPAAPEAATVTITKPLPEIASVGPGTVVQGSLVTLSLSGKRFAGATSVTITPSAGFTVHNPPAVNADGTLATVDVTIDASAAPGAYRVTIVTPVGSSSGTLTEANTLTVTTP